MPDPNAVIVDGHELENAVVDLENAEMKFASGKPEEGWIHLATAGTGILLDIAISLRKLATRDHYDV